MDEQLRVTPLSVAIHRESENPVYGKNGGQGQGILHVSVDDDGGGRFLVVKQLEDEPDPGIVRLDVRELPYLLEAAQRLGLITERSSWLIEATPSEEEDD